MKAIILALMLMSMCVSAEELELGFYSVRLEEERAGADALFGLDKTADRVIWHDEEKNFDLGLGRTVDVARHPIDLKFQQIKGFLKDEKHKDLVVVWFDKTVMWNEGDFVSKRAKEVTAQMREVGYKRVVILGAHSIGVHYVADTKVSNKKAEQGEDDQAAASVESKP